MVLPMKAVIKRKTITKVVSALKVPSKAMGKATDTADIEEAKAVASKMMKKPAAAKADVEEAEAESATESESEAEAESATESESEAEEVSKTMKKPAAAAAPSSLRLAVAHKMMKKPAAAVAKAANKKDVEKDDDEASEDSEEEEDEDEVTEASEEEQAEVSGKVLKKPAGAAAKVEDMEVEEEEESGEESDEESMEEEDDKEEVGAQLVPFETKEPTENELAAERTKELKSISASDLKELLISNGLETGTKDAMIKSLCKHEAKARAVAREQKARIRAVVVKKKMELEELSIPELGKLCNDAGLKGLKSKPERVQRLLVLWQEQDGVDQALSKIANDERQNELRACDNAKLQKLCKKLEVDPFVKEVVVERISKHENMKGFNARPAMKQGADAPQEDQKLDMIDALLANEALRKKERELKSKQEEKVAQKRKEIKAMSVEELKKRLAKKGLEATGKRDDMVETLFIAGVQEEAATARKDGLQSKSTQDLKELISLNGLETGSKEQMVKAVLAHEAKCLAELKAFEGKVDEVVAQKRSQLEGKSKAHLKEMCASKGLPVGGETSDKIDRLLDEARKEGEFDKIVCMNNRNKRLAELMAMDKPAVLKLGEKYEVDPFVKDIMVERIMSKESEAGDAIAAIDAEQPAAKKARTSRK